MSAPAPADADPALDGLLGRLVSGSLVLTDGQGAISKWSDSADLLFGRSAEEVLGRSFFETLVAAPLAPAGEGWRRYLEAGESPGVRGLVELLARHASGDAFAVELVFIPVRLDQGFEFSLFLEDLAFALPPVQMTARLRAQHPVVVRALRASLSAEVQPWEGGRTAGTLIAFRPLAPVPWVETELAARERAASPAAEPGLDPADAVPGVPDAGEVVERLLGAVHRLDALEAAVTELPHALEARLAALEAAASAPVDTSALQARVARLEGPAARELREAVRTAVRLAQGAAERAVPEPAVDVSEPVLDAVCARTDAVERAVEAVRRTGADTADEVAVLRDRVDAADGRAAAVATSLETVQSLTAERTAGADARFAELRSELTGVLATVEYFRTGFDEARHAALAARREAEQAHASAAAAGTANRRSARELSSAWRELLSPGGAGTESGDRGVRVLPSRETPPPPPPRGSREGFDDQSAPIALLGLDGRFTELNAAFEQLVGYPEHEFHKAVWPSAHDRGAYREQQEQLAALASGELESVGLRSTYMHGQGLMVPVTGRISAVRGEDGRPAYLVLRAEERASR